LAVILAFANLHYEITHFRIKNVQFFSTSIILSLCKFRSLTYETNFPVFVSMIQSLICVSMI